MSAADGYHATEYHVDGTDVVVPKGVTLQTGADHDPIEQMRARFADVTEEELIAETNRAVAQVKHKMFRESIFRAAGRIALARLTRKDLSNRCPVCHAGDLDQCPTPNAQGKQTRQQRRASARESAKAPREWVWYRCETCRATMRILSRKR